MSNKQGQKSCEENAVSDSYHDRVFDRECFLRDVHDPQHEIDTISRLGERRRLSTSSTYTIAQPHAICSRRSVIQVRHGAAAEPGASACHLQSEKCSFPPTKTQDLYKVAKLMVSYEGGVQDFEDADISPLWHASREPPVTVESLSELEPTRISSDPKLRHDMNFERDVSFRPNYDGAQGAAKRGSAQRYWAVLAVEFALYMQHATCRNHRCLLDKINRLEPAKRPPLRLKRMLRTLAGILRTLVLGEDLASVDEILDIDFLMAQMAHGTHSFGTLADWLHLVLKKACSPVRDASIDAFATRVRCSIGNNDPCELAHAIEELFVILETMKLVSCPDLSLPSVALD